MPSHAPPPTAAALAEACRAGDVPTARTLVHANPELLHAKNPHPWHRTYGGQLYRRSAVQYPIEVATYYGHAELVRWLLAQEPERNLAARLHTSVGVAMRNAQPQVLDEILDAIRATLDARPNLSHERDGWQLLHTAAEQVCAPLVELLLQRGVPAEDPTVDGWQPIHAAVWYGWPLGGHPWTPEHARIVTMLLDAGATPSTWILAGAGDTKRLASHLATSDETANSLAREHPFGIRTPLGIAAWHGHAETVDCLLRAGADPDGRPIEESNADDSDSALVFAAAHGHGAICHALVRGGASLGRTPTVAAHAMRQIYELGDPKLIAWALAAGGKPTIFSQVRARDYDALTQLVERTPTAPNPNWPGPGTVFGGIVAAASWLGEDRVLAIALDRRPELLPREAIPEELRRAVVSHNRDGAFENYLRVLEQLLDHLGADRAVGADACALPGGHAATAPRDDAELLGSIIEFVVREYLQPVFGIPLRIEEAVQLVALFLSRGADLTACDPESGQSALESAARIGSPELVEALLHHGAATNPAQRDASFHAAQSLGFVALAERIATHGNT